MIGRWRMASLRWLGRHPWQLGLALVGVALGVAVVVAVDLATTSAARAFERSMRQITGDASHRIVGPPRGIDEDFYRRLRIDHDVRASAPVIEGFAEWHGRTLRVLGVDPFARAGASDRLAAVAGDDLAALVTDADTVLLAARNARRRGVEPGDTIELSIAGSARSLRVVGLLQSRRRPEAALEGLVVADIANAQRWFGRAGRIDYIDLAVSDATARRLEAALPPGLRLEPTSARRRQARDMTAAFRTNLNAMGLLAVVVGVFLIYNTMTFSVVQRRRLIGTLRALGATRGMVFGQVVAETVLLGAAGTVVGLAAGVALAEGLVGLVTRTINDLYFVLTVRELVVDAAVLAKGSAIGLAAALVGALGPAVEAAGAPPEAAGRRTVLERRARRAVPALAGVGAVLVTAAAALPLASEALAAGFAALAALVVGAALLVPQALRLLVPPAAAAIGRTTGALGRMAAAGIAAALSRTGLAVIALTVALAATVGVGVMIDSFRTTVEHWLKRTLTADLYLAGADRVAARHFAPLPDGLDARVRALEGVAGVSTGWRVEVDTPAGPTPLLAFDPTPQSFAGVRLKRGGPPAAVRQRFVAGEAVLVSEPWATRRDAGPGDTVTLLTPAGRQRVEIAGVYYDYNTDRGLVLMHRDLYDRWWPGGNISSIGIFVADGRAIADVAARVRELIAGEASVRLHASAEIRRRSLEVFDRTFAITGVLRTLALAVAFVGVLTALLALELERGRELAVLRATGATPGQVRTHVLGQTGLMGLLAGALSLPLGLAMAELLIDVINRRAFGWTIVSRIDTHVLAEALVLAVAAAVLAGVWPAWRAGRIEPATALREE